MDLDYGRVRCNRCGEFYGLDETHVCASAVPLALGPGFEPAAVPDPDRAHAAGLTWVSPLTPRPIPLGPSEDHAEVRPALDIQADRFWTHARHGLGVGRAEVAFDAAAFRYALAASPARSPHLRAALVDAGVELDTALTDYAKDLCA